MANEKQIGLLMVRAREAGITGDRKKYAAMQNDEIDAELARIKNLGAVKQKQVPVPEEVVEAKPTEVTNGNGNGVCGNNFGMAAKAVINTEQEHRAKGFPRATDNTLVEDIVYYYNLLQTARARVGPSPTTKQEAM